MKKNLLIALCVLLFTSCATKQKYGYAVKKISHNAGGLVTYKDYDYSYQEELKACKNEMLDSAKTSRRLNAVPKGGSIIIQTGDYTIAAANPENYTYIIQDSVGNEVLRTNGTKGLVPNYYVNPQTRVTTWSAYDMIILNNEIKTPFKVFLINKIGDNRSEFLITKASN